jgi:hypothetical protein
MSLQDQVQSVSKKGKNKKKQKKQKNNDKTPITRRSLPDWPPVP